MILQIQQTKVISDLEWSITLDSGESFAVAKAPFSKQKYEIHVEYADGSFQRLYFNPEDNSWGSKLADRASFKVFEDMDNRNRIGTIAQKTEKIGFLKSYIYRDLEIKGEVYQLYEIGMGAEGMFLCIYDKERLVATVDKSLQVVNHRDSYTAYLLEEKYAHVAVLSALYYDSVSYDCMFDRSLYSRKTTLTYTVQAPLKAKYDPSFIPMIKEMK